MITAIRKTGMSQDAMVISYVSIWDNMLEADARMMFYGAPTADVVDVFVDANRTVIYYYPHNTGDMVEKFTAKEQEIRSLWQRAKDAENSQRTVFTLDLNRMRVVTSEDFTAWSPPESGYGMFVLDTDAKNGGFPNIFVHSKITTGPYSWAFRVQSYSSKICMKPVKKATETGKEFVFRFLASWMQKEFQEEIPQTYALKFPSNGQDKLPTYLNTDALRKYADSLTSKTPKQTLQGIVSSESSPFGEEEDPKNTKLKIQKEILDKSSVSLSDMFTVGFPGLKKMIPLSDQIITINQDVSGGFRRGCIYEGKMHILVWKEDDTDIAGWLGADDEDCVMHTSEDTFPKVSSFRLPLLPAPSDSEKGLVQ